jgi:hypothetical protein
MRLLHIQRPNAKEVRLQLSLLFMVLKVHCIAIEAVAFAVTIEHLKMFSFLCVDSGLVCTGCQQWGKGSPGLRGPQQPAEQPGLAAQEYTADVSG